MSAAPRNLYVEQGASWTLAFTWYPDDPATSAPNDLTGATARMQIRVRQGSPVLVDATTENGKIQLGGTDGTVSIGLTAEDTDALAVKQAVYDLEIVMATGAVFRLLEGKVKVGPNVTQDPGDPVVRC